MRIRTSANFTLVCGILSYKTVFFQTAAPLRICQNL